MRVLRAWPALALFGSAALSVACTGADDVLVAGPPAASFVGSSPLRRLSNAEYLHSLRDLFPGLTPAALPALPSDVRIDGFENDARSLASSDVHVERYEEIAFRFAELATADDAALARILPCEAWSTRDEEDECASALVASFGRRAFRRPLEEDEAQRYLARFSAFRATIDFRAAVELTLMALVQAPQFLYRIEIPTIDATAPMTSGDGGAAVVQVDEFALATRLSYLLWESTPDDALLDLAAGGRLHEDAVLAGEVDRMLEDPRATDAIVDFHRQWLDFDRMLEAANATRAPEIYPDWSVELQLSERAELDRFVAWEMDHGAGSLPELLTSRHTLVDDRLAALYGVRGPGADGAWVEADLPTEQRAGLLTRAGILASHSHVGGVSPPLRGAFILERLLCQPHLTPPPVADLSTPTPMEGEGPVTNRALFERRTAPATCAGCHTRINAIGFAFEHYDATGAFQALDHGLPIDASGELTDVEPAGPFTDAIDLSERFARSETVAACATKSWVRFALGRSIESADAHLTRLARAAYDSSDGDIREVMRAIATSPELRMQPGMQE